MLSKGNRLEQCLHQNSHESVKVKCESTKVLEVVFVESNHKTPK